MNDVKKKILSFLYREYYLFWASGLTAGVYTGSKYHLFNPYILIAEITVIILILIIGILITRRILNSEHSLNISNHGKINIKFKGNKLPFRKTSRSDFKQNNARLVILVIIPFLILFVIGNSIINIYKYNESKSIFLSLYENNSSAGDNIVIEGRVSNHPRYKYGNLNFLLEADKIYIYDCNGNLNSLFNAGELINIKLDSTGIEPILRDDHLRLTGSLDKNDSKNFMAGGCDEIVFIADCGDIKKIESSNLSYRIFSFRSRLYCCLKNAFYKNLEIEDACIAEAVILGNRNNVPEYLTESFKRCGVYHLFAISGLHISFFISLIYLVFKKMRLSYFIFWASVIFLVVYNFLVGERASILRASIMAVFILLAKEWNREYSHKILLYLSYIIIIIFNPYFIYDLGFWMTYASMAALVFIYPAAMRLAGNIFPFLKLKRSSFIKIALITLSIQTVLFPVLAYFFKEVSLISPVANILIIPVFYILLSILMVSSFVTIIWPPVGGLLLKPSSIIFVYILKTVKILSKFDFCIINFDSFPVKNVIVYYIVLLIILFTALTIVKRININKRKQKASNIP
ncbi:MAG: ComEC/Rec2 family competence protein [Candidatus Hydromicrobium sp.]|nr:ComEC/Rec2 family competence protein [Candidatus Hydromicrobium sp.]